MIVVKCFAIFLSFFFVLYFSFIKLYCVETLLLSDVNRLVSICGHESFLLYAQIGGETLRKREIYNVKIKKGPSLNMYSYIKSTLKYMRLPTI